MRIGFTVASRCCVRKVQRTLGGGLHSEPSVEGIFLCSERQFLQGCLLSYINPLMRFCLPARTNSDRSFWARLSIKGGGTGQTTLPFPTSLCQDSPSCWGCFVARSTRKAAGQSCCYWQKTCLGLRRVFLRRVDPAVL